MFWSKIAILPCFRSSILFHGARVQNRNQQVFPRLYRPANPVPLNPLPFSWPHIFMAKEWEIFLLLHKSNVSFHPGKATSFSTNNVFVIWSSFYPLDRNSFAKYWELSNRIWEGKDPLHKELLIIGVHSEKNWMKLSCFVNFDIISCLCSWLSCLVFQVKTFQLAGSPLF